MKRTLILLVAPLVVLVTAPQAPGNPFEFFGFNSRDAAMGRAVTAAACDYTAIYYNPAMLTQVEGITLGFGYYNAMPTLRIDGRDTDVDRISGIPFGFSVPIEALDRFKIVAGFAFQAPNKRVARYLLIPYERPRFTMYANRSQRILTFMAVGVEIAPWLSVGAGASVLGGLGGGPVLHLKESWTEEPSAGTLTSDIVPSFAPFAGVLVKPFERLSLGFVYRRQLDSEIDVPAMVLMPDIYAPDVNPLEIPLIRATVIEAGGLQVSHFTPDNIAFGAAFQVTENFLVTADVTILFWSQFKYFAPVVTLDLYGEDGGSGHLGDWVEIIDQILPEPDFNDVLMPALGMEWRFMEREKLELFARGGYFFRESPVSDQVGETNFVDSDLHAFSCGLGIVLKDVTEVFSKPVGIDFHFQYQVLTNRRTVKASITDPIGDYESDGEILNAGMTVIMHF